MGIRGITAILIAALVAVALAACGGSSDSSGGDATAATPSGGGSSTKLALVAYSTPQEAYDAIIPGYQKTAAGQGRQLQRVVRRRRATRAAPSTPVSRPTSSRSRSRPTSRASSTTSSSHADWDAGPYKGMVTDSVAAIVVRKGNPKHIKTWDDLIKPGVQVLTPEPVHLGQRALEHHGRLRRPAEGGQDQGPGARLPQDAAHQARPGPGLERPQRAATRSWPARATR